MIDRRDENEFLLYVFRTQERYFFEESYRDSVSPERCNRSTSNRNTAANAGIVVIVVSSIAMKYSNLVAFNSSPSSMSHRSKEST
mmetsp:Transcript_21225/g.52585  ORF Transcript_21225/g.52585 Transcript_21225/m.52585 type:complete len:85 (-) Transcript_21225:504-758(-)